VASPSLPDGIVTFLFTDIEGSTRLVAEIGDDAYATVLDAEQALVVDAAVAEGGVPFGSEGDAHFVAFRTAAAAVRAAVRAQRALAAHPWPHGPVRVRMGIHTGEARLAGDDYLGLEVHRAARVASAAHGGQVLVTDATRALAGEPAGDIGMRDLGEHRLKDLTRPERLFQVVAPGLDASFAALRTLDATPNNLPPQLTSFVDRAELANAAALLGRTRLLTLTGPGGTGKTRLSLALAGDCVDRFPGGAWFVPLAPVTDPELVASAIAASIGVLAANKAPIDRVRDHLRDRTAVLVLDNFEQVVEGASVVADLLRSAPNLTVIASSRAPLRIAGEQEFPVPPLSLPPAGARDPETLVASEAVRLFVERAMAVRPDFALTDENGLHVAEIVRRLDGLPLAIELAAARIRLLSPAAMAQRLGDRLGLLSAGGRDLPERQRTLRGAIAWSFDLLAPVDRDLFARLGVFAGGGPLEEAEAVCAATDAADGGTLDVLGGLERLAEQSLVRVELDAHGDVRFTMLETIREYALERLAEHGAVEPMRDRHAAAFLAFAEREGREGGGGDRGHALDRFEEEHDNLRAALDHLVAAGDHDGAARLGFATWRFWQMRGHLAEGRNRLDAVLAMPGWGAEPSGARLRALEAAGGLAYWTGDMVAASADYGAAVEEARRLRDDGELANALYNKFFARGPTSGVDEWLKGLADDDKAELDEALEIWTRLGDEGGVARAQWGLGEHHVYRREYALAEAVLTAALAVFERRGEGFWIAWTSFTRALGRSLSGRVNDAGADLAVALREFRQSRDISGAVLVMAALSSALLLAERPRDAYAVGAASRRAVAETGLHIATLWPSSDIPLVDPDTAVPELRTAAAEGAAWSREEAFERAIALADELAAGSSAPA
jgi:predicted ATPase/class 3 adenylate cyclase